MAADRASANTFVLTLRLFWSYPDERTLKWLRTAIAPNPDQPDECRSMTL
jgi:hypothetical protein